MRVLLAVLEDLWLFAAHAVSALFITVEDRNIPSAVVRVRSTFMQAPALPAGNPVLHPSTSYFIGEQEVAVYDKPVVAFDTLIFRVGYGQLVHIDAFQGRWAHMSIGDLHGWILKDALREQARDVQPVFLEGVAYDTHNDETRKLRMTISDQYQGEECGMMLQDNEYVTYMLHKKGLSIPWGMERPRIAGTWQRYLAGKRGVHISITPKSDSVMEYISEDGIGHLRYVLSVFPDDSVRLSGVGVEEEGVYDESMMAKEEYKELRPVFIEIQ
jgi:hypothetical protein